MSSDTYNPKDPDTVYLRPQPETRGVDYIKSIEKAGMVIDHHTSIAMYTSNPAAAAGPQGPPGEDQNSWFDTIIASASDEDSPISLGGPKTTFRAPYPLDLSSGYVRISLTNAPVGAAFIVQLTVNGANLFSTPVQIDDGQKTSVTSLTPAVMNFTYIPDDAEFLVYVNQTGSTETGTGLKVAVTGIKTT